MQWVGESSNWFGLKFGPLGRIIFVYELIKITLSKPYIVNTHTHTHTYIYIYIYITLLNEHIIMIWPYFVQ